MSTPYVTPSSSVAPAGPGLNQAERVVDTFFAPTKTFADILRSASWWLPFVLMVIFTVATGLVVQKQVGFDRVTENSIAGSPSQQEQINQLPPDQRAQRMAVATKFTRIITLYVVPVGLLIALSLYALVLWGCFNFGLGAQTRYGQVLAVLWYAALPYVIRAVLTMVILYVGSSAESYDYKNPVGTNPAYFLPAAAPWLKALLSRLDLFEFWNVALITLGMSVISRKTIAQAAAIVVGIYVLVTLILVGISAATG